jgi:hypothetical protein
MTTENQPHVVCRRNSETAYIRDSYAEAFQLWQALSSHEDPWLIATLGRVIDPATPIIDVNE